MTGVQTCALPISNGGRRAADLFCSRHCQLAAAAHGWLTFRRPCAAVDGDGGRLPSLRPACASVCSPREAAADGARKVQGIYRQGLVPLRKSTISSGEGVFLKGRVYSFQRSRRSRCTAVYSLRERHHSRGMECAPMLPGKIHVEKACPERPIPRGLRPAWSPRPVGVSAGSRQRHSSRPALFRIRRFLFLSGKFSFPVGRDNLTDRKSVV